MRFKYVLLFIFGITLATNAYADSVNPLGLVVRPSFVSHLIDRLNSESRSHPFRLEMGSVLFDGKLTCKLSADWSSNSGRLILRTFVEDLNVDAELFAASRQLDEKGNKIWNPLLRSQHAMKLHLKKLPLEVRVDPTNFRITLALDLERLKQTQTQASGELMDEFLSQIDADAQGFPEITRLMQEPSLKEQALNGVLLESSIALTSFLRDTIRNLSYAEYVAEATPTSPLWKKGPLYQKDALTLELIEPSQSQKQIAFAFHRIQDRGIIANDDRLEIYVNALFLTNDIFQSLTNLDPLKTPPDILLMRATDALTKQEARLPDDYRRPLLPPSQSELSLVIPRSLINLALSTVYKEGLLRFRTKLDLGKTTKSLLSPEAPETLLLVQINPTKAPQLDFNADRLDLDVTDYSLNLGTWLEDRLIPYTSLTTHTRVTASLTIDNNAQYVNLKLDPSTFEMALTDPKRRLNEDDQKIIQRVAEHLWKEFLTSYSELNLFKTVINTDRAPVEIVSVQVAGDQILLNMNVDWKKAKL